MVGCEESSCDKMAFAICMHCDRRLCTNHIIVHEKNLLHDVNELTQEAHEFEQQMISDLETAIQICDNAEVDCKTWQATAIKRIHQLFDQKMKTIANHREYLKKQEHHFTDQYAVKVKKQLERMEAQPTANMEALNDVRSALYHIKHNYTSIKNTKNKLLLNLPQKIKITSLPDGKVRDSQSTAPVPHAVKNTFYYHLSERFCLHSFK